MDDLPSGTVTFLFTDIEGSTARWEHQPEAMRVALARHDALIRAAIAGHGGHVVKTMGDAFHAAFSRALDGVAAALDAQQWLQAEGWGEIGPLRVRMALHTGAAEERDGDYYGPPLNRAARLLATGHGGQVLLSDVTAGLVRDDLPDGYELLDLGEHRLKDLIRPERIFQVRGGDLPSDFPSLRTLDARPNNLPIQPTALIGRDGAVAEILALIEGGGRLVTLTGPGGTGKTRLSMQVAAELDVGLDDGAWLVELAPVADPALVPSTIAQALGVREFGGRPALEAVREHVRSRSLLLVLDNFEQILPAATVVSDLLAASPGLRILVSSREPLRLRGEVEYPVPPLALPDASHPATPSSLAQSAAVALFVERASAVRPGFAVTDTNATAIAEICHRLDGLPLAIELAAARARLLTPEAMVSRLERRLPMLTGGARDLPARQRTLRDAIAWSYDLLDDAERRLFRRLAVFVGGWSLEAVEVVCAPDDADLDVLGGLDSLVSKSLVKLDEEVGGAPRFRMLETIREFGLEQLEASGEQALIRRRHLRWGTDFSLRHELRCNAPDILAWMDELTREHDNLRAALAWSLADSDPASAETGLWLAGSLGVLWFMRDHIAEGRQWFGQILAANPVPDPGGPDADRVGPLSTVSPAQPRLYGTNPRVIAQIYLGLFRGFLEDVDGSIVALEEAVALARRLGDELGAAHALVSLGTNVGGTGDHARAIMLGEEGAALGRAIGDPFGVWRTVGNLAAIMHTAGDHDRAYVLGEESLAAARHLGPWQLAQSLRRLGLAVWGRGDLDRATVLFEEAADHWASIGVRRGRHWAAKDLGQIGLERGNLPAARRWFGESLTLCKALDDRWNLAACFEGVAATLAQESDGASPVTAVATARMLGTAGALRAQIGRPNLPHQQRLAEQAEKAARARLGDAAFERARAEGGALSLDEAVGLALDAMRRR